MLEVRRAGERVSGQLADVIEAQVQPRQIVHGSGGVDQRDRIVRNVQREIRPADLRNRFQIQGGQLVELQMKEPEAGQPVERVPLHFEYSVICQRYRDQFRAVDDGFRRENLDAIPGQVQRLQLGQIVETEFRYGLQKIVAELHVPQLRMNAGQEYPLRQIVEPIRLQVNVPQVLERIERRRLYFLEVIVVQDQPEQIRERPQRSLRENVGRERETQLENVQAVLDAYETVVVQLRQMVERQAELL